MENDHPLMTAHDQHSPDSIFGVQHVTFRDCKGSLCLTESAGSLFSLLYPPNRLQLQVTTDVVHVPPQLFFFAGNFGCKMQDTSPF